MKKYLLKSLLLASIVTTVTVRLDAHCLFDANVSKGAGITSNFNRPCRHRDMHLSNDFFDEGRDPFIEIERLRRNMENSLRNFDNYFQTIPSFNELSSKRYQIPRFDMKEQNDKYLISMEVPGVKESDIDVKIENGRLLVNAKTSEVKDDNSTTYYHHERRLSSYKSEILLPNDIDKKSLKKEYVSGLLNITINKKK